MAANTPSAAGATENNHRLFRRFTKVFAENNVREYTQHAEKLAKWLSDAKAYYTAARPEIIKLLLVAQMTLRRALGVGPDLSVPFNVSYYADYPLIRPYVQMVQTVVHFEHLFLEPSLAAHVKALRETITPLSNIHNALSAPAQPLSSASRQIPISGNKRPQIVNELPRKQSIPFYDPDIQIIENPNASASSSTAPQPLTLPAAMTRPEPSASVRTKKVKRKKTFDFNALAQADVDALLKKKESENALRVKVKVEPSSHPISLHSPHFETSTSSRNQSTIMPINTTETSRSMPPPASSKSPAASNAPTNPSSVPPQSQLTESTIQSSNMSKFPQQSSQIQMPIQETSVAMRPSTISKSPSGSPVRFVQAEADSSMRSPLVPGSVAQSPKSQMQFRQDNVKLKSPAVANSPAKAPETPMEEEVAESPKRPEPQMQTETEVVLLVKSPLPPMEMPIGNTGSVEQAELQKKSHPHTSDIRMQIQSPEQSLGASASSSVQDVPMEADNAIHVDNEEPEPQLMDVDVPTQPTTERGLGMESENVEKAKAASMSSAATDKGVTSESQTYRVESASQPSPQSLPPDPLPRPTIQTLQHTKDGVNSSMSISPTPPSSIWHGKPPGDLIKTTPHDKVINKKVDEKNLEATKEDQYMALTPAPSIIAVHTPVPGVQPMAVVQPIQISVAPIFEKDLTPTAMDQPTGVFSGSSMRVIAIQKGPKKGSRITIAFDIEKERFLGVATWVARNKVPQRSLRELEDSGVCISLGCYITQELAEQSKESGCDTLEKQVSTIRSVWPTSGEVVVNVKFEDKREDLPLAPPFQVTPDNFMDISIFANEGTNVIHLSHYRDISQYTFVLYVHHPTRAQLKQVKERRQKDNQWTAWLADLTKPLNIPLKPATAQTC